MQLISVIIAMLAATTVQAAALHKWCTYPGQPCYMLKRAVDVTSDVQAAADALSAAMPVDASFAQLQGENYVKVKRAADAVSEVKRSAEALAEAMAALDEE